MEDFAYRSNRFDIALNLLPGRLRVHLQAVDKSTKASAEEFRLRVGRPLSIALPNGEIVPDNTTDVTGQDLSDLLSIVSHGSVHSFSESLKWGYLTAEGGHRVGICGSAIVKNSEITGIRNISSASVRIAKEVRGIGKKLCEELFKEAPFPNILIVSPPGGGKTTLLRDMIRNVSNSGVRVAVADERNEISAMHEGRPGFDIGSHTDVIEGAEKAGTLMMLLRAMNPQVIAVDEITILEDMRAMERAYNCGISLLATAHAKDLEDLSRRSYYAGGGKMFQKVVVIRGEGSSRSYQVMDWKND